MKKKRARTKTETFGSRLKKAVKKVLKKKPAADTLAEKSKSAEKPLKKNGVKAPRSKTASPTISRNRMYVTLKGQTRTGAEQTSVPGDLPFSYNKTLLIVLVRDPEWVYAYWDFSSETWNWIQGLLKKNPSSRAVLKIHNLSTGDSSTVDVHLDAKNWYLCLGISNAEFEIELGLIEPSGRFHSISRSNRIKTPRNRPSEEIDPLWTPVHFEEIYRLSGGANFAGSSVPAVLKKNSP